MKKAFSLLELSIVILIISLLAMGTLVGMNLRETVVINQIMDNVATVNQAVKQFIDQYNALPGDIWDANQKLVDSNGTPATGGNGDNVVDSGAPRNEDLHFWQHLQYSGLLHGEYDGTTNVPGQGVMRGPIDSSGFRVIVADNSSLGLELSIFVNGVGGYPALTPDQASSLDDKFDDGAPTTGNIRAVTGTGSAVQCVNGAIYNSGSKDISCIIQFIIRSPNL